MCIFCNPSCSTDSSVVKASKNTKLRSHPTSSFSIRPFATVLLVAKRLEVARKVAFSLIPLALNSLFATRSATWITDVRPPSMKRRTRRPALLLSPLDVSGDFTGAIRLVGTEHCIDISSASRFIERILFVLFLIAHLRVEPRRKASWSHFR